MKKSCRALSSLLLVLITFVMLLTSCSLLGAEKSNNGSSVQSVYLGETAINPNGVEFVVQSVKDTQKIGYSTTENNFIVVTIKISNKGKESWEQNPNNCVLILNGAEYEYSSATYSLDDSMSGFTEINPNITKTMSIAFETPTKSSEGSYSIKLSGYSLWSDDSVTIILEERPN